MVTIITLLIVIGFPLAFVYKVVAVKSNEELQKEQQRIDLYAKAIENGVELPGDFSRKPETQKTDPPKKNSNKRYFGLLIIGILLFFSSIGLLIALYTIYGIREGSAVSFATIPLCLGIGFIASYYVLKREQKKQNKGNRENGE